MEGRLRFIFILFTLSFFVVLVRLYYWQVYSFENLKGLSDRQTLTSMTIPGQRGSIFALDGSPLVINEQAYFVYAEPKKIKNIKEVINILTKNLGVPEASLTAKIKESVLVWIPIAAKVESSIVDEIKKKKLKGIGFIEESRRFYPEASMAAHLLGFVGKNSKGEDSGYFGIEGYYDEQLKGRDGRIRLEEDALGNPILSARVEEIEAEDGRDLYLTIDRSVQFIAETKLKEGIEKYQAKGGTVVILNPLTGEVLAMASFPSYDPREFSNYPTEFYKNPAVASSYEPGSTFKALIVASALNEDKVKTDSKFAEDGPIEIGEYKIETWNKKYHGEINLREILEYSSNVGMVYVQRQLDEDVFFDYLKRLGFGEPTEIDLQEETSPGLRPKNSWYEIDYATASFGQGIAVTPLQMVRAVATIANGGKLIHPYVVKSIRTKNGKVIDKTPNVVRNIFKKEIASLVTELMVAAVNNGETRFIKPAGYRIAGKTGTAQIPIAGHYDTEKTIASFVGFAPAEDSKFIMLVTFIEPTASPWGSETAAPVFFEIAKELFSYYKISPSE